MAKNQQARDTLIIMTGGTIDAEPYHDPMKPPKNATMLAHSLIPGTVEHLGHGETCDYLSWRAKDSKHFTGQDLQDLAKIIRTSTARHIIITHGTDAMPENSRRIRDLLKAPDKTLRKDAALRRGAFVRGEAPACDKVVVFTGAMMPLANGPESDAYKNIEYILGHIRKWPEGVRVVMHGQSFDPEGLEKDFNTYTFRGTQLPDRAGRGR